METES